MHSWRSRERTSLKIPEQWIYIFGIRKRKKKREGEKRRNKQQERIFAEERTQRPKVWTDGGLKGSERNYERLCLPWRFKSWHFKSTKYVAVKEDYTGGWGLTIRIIENNSADKTRAGGDENDGRTDTSSAFNTLSYSRSLSLFISRRCREEKQRQLVEPVQLSGHSGMTRWKQLR